MSRRMILWLAAVILPAAAALGCGGSESATKTEPRAGADVIALRAPLDTRGTDAALLHFGVPHGWKGNEDPNRRLPVAAIEKPAGSGICRFFVQIVAGPRGGKGLLQPGEGKLLRQSAASKRSVKVIAPGPPRVAIFSFRIYDAPLGSTGPAAISVGEFQISGEPAVPPLVVIARGGLDGCTTKVPLGVVAETRSALQALIDQMSIEIRRPG